MTPPKPPSFSQGPSLDGKVKEMWVAARTAFWQRDLAKAEKLYKELLEGSDEADAAGELGNIYVQQRRYDEAGEMYFEAAMRHLNGENPMQAMMVVGPLSRLAPEKANEVRQKIMQKRNAAFQGAKDASEKAAQ